MRLGRDVRPPGLRPLYDIGDGLPGWPGVNADPMVRVSFIVKREVTPRQRSNIKFNFNYSIATIWVCQDQGPRARLVRFFLAVGLFEVIEALGEFSL